MIDLSVNQAVKAISSGELDAAEYFNFYRDRAAADADNAFLSVAESHESRPGPLQGVPIGVKDLFCVEGVESRACSIILKGYIPPYTSSVVERLLEAGASYLGKLNMDEFAMGSSNETSAAGPATNPWDRTRVPGGSSGGSAAAVAAGTAPWALGSDTGGSIRQPAAFCGVVGMKPTYGTASRHGMIAFASSLDQAGPVARDVTDAALMLRTILGRDPLDATSTDPHGEIGLPSAESLAGKRFGVPVPIDWDGVQPGVREVFEASLKTIESLGGEIVEAPLPHAGYALPAYYIIASAEASANLSRFDGVRFGFRSEHADGLTEMYESTRGEGFGAEVKRRIMLGTYALSAGYYDAYYKRAQQVRTRIAEDFRDAFAGCDLIVSPSAPSVAFPLGEKTDDLLAMYYNDVFTVPSSLAGLPGISVPAGHATPDGAGASDAANGLPVGLQIVAPHFGENALLEAAHAFERAAGPSGAPWQREVS